MFGWHGLPPEGWCTRVNGGNVVGVLLSRRGLTAALAVVHLHRVASAAWLVTHLRSHSGLEEVNQILDKGSIVSVAAASVALWPSPLQAFLL